MTPPVATAEHTAGKHTQPWPWKVRPHWNDEDKFEVYPDRETQWGNPSAIAEVTAHRFDVGDLSAEEALANARLIAAAPDLLEALSELLQANSYYFPAGNPWGDKARSAIARAEGRQS